MSLYFNILQTMDPEVCHVGQRTTLSTALQQRYDQLSSPQCTNFTYIDTFVVKLLPFYQDADVRNVLCHLDYAIINLNLIHVSAIII